MASKVDKDGVKLEIIERLTVDREISDKKYAIKLIEKIVFALVAMILAGVFGALLRLVILS